MSEPSPLSRLDTTVPHSARLWNYLLGGKDHFAIDRSAGDKLLTILPELFREFSEYRMIVYSLALILMMILRPQGLFGIKELWELRVWRRVFRRGGKR